MVIVKLTGGLGNQLFQYAYGRAFSMEKNEPLYLDTSWYKGRINRSYELNNFKIEAKVASWLTRSIHKKSILVDTEGNWHHEKFFKKYTEQIKKDIQLTKPLSQKNALIQKQIQSTNSVSIHIRGGDYVKGKYSALHNTCNADYYTNAIKIIKEKVQNAHFFIFTDDIEWAKNLIAFPEPFTIVSDTANQPHEELILMSSCKNKIIANSTFSWWAAWLGQDTNIVIAPKKWFNDTTFNAREINLPHWIQL